MQILTKKVAQKLICRLNLIYLHKLIRIWEHSELRRSANLRE